MRYNISSIYVERSRIHNTDGSEEALTVANMTVRLIGPKGISEGEQRTASIISNGEGDVRREIRKVLNNAKTLSHDRIEPHLKIA